MREWEEAELYCRAKGWELASIHSQAEISSADYTMELSGARGFYLIEITDKAGQAHGFSVMKK